MSENLYAIRKDGNRELRAENYTGKRRFTVCCNNRAVTVAAGTMVDAIWTAGKYWGMDPRKAEFHQDCRVVRC